MKTFTIIKVGYTAGIYGCSGEYFHLFYADTTDNVGTEELFFCGMYGADSRIAKFMEEKGFESQYSQSIYGQLKRKDIPKNRFLDEEKAIEELKQRLK